MKCPEHPEHECRDEYSESGYTGFCLLCLKHYPRCSATFYMDPCCLQKDHQEPHHSRRGQRWTANDDGSYNHLSPLHGSVP